MRKKNYGVVNRVTKSSLMSKEFFVRIFSIEMFFTERMQKYSKNTRFASITENVFDETENLLNGKAD
jgi:hypothetical protein